MKKLYLSLVIGIIFLAGTVSALGEKIAYIVPNSNNLDSNELAIKNILSQENYNLDIYSNTMSFNVDDYEVIIVGEDVNNIFFDNKQHKTLFLSRVAARKSGLSAESGQTSGGKVINIIERNHFITDGFNEGVITVYNSLEEMHYVKSCYALGAENLAIDGGSIRSVILAVPEESLLLDGSCSKRTALLEQRNLFFGLIKAGKWNNNAKNLFKNSAAWLIDGRLNEPPELTQDIPAVEWQTGSTATLELSNYFTDPNEDDINYDLASTSDNQEINIIEFNLETGHIVFSSNPGWTGTDWIIFKAIDEKGLETESNLVTLRVSANPSSNAPVLDFIDDIKTYSGALVDINPIATDADTLPEDLTFTFTFPLNENGVWQIPTTSMGTFTAVVRVEDSDGNFDEQQVNIYVTGADYPIVNFISDKTVNEGSLLSFSVTAFDPMANPINLTAANLPQGARFDNNGDGTGDFLWTPDYSQSGEYDITFTAEDNQGFTGTEPVTIRVTNQEAPPSFGDINLCDVKSNLLKINIKNPDEGGDFKINEDIEAEIEVENDAGENLKVNVEAYLYDLTDDKSVDDANDKQNIDNGKEKQFDFTLNSPSDVENSEFVLLVIANGKKDNDYCNYEYIDLNIEREEHDVIIDEITARPNSVFPGERVDTEIKVNNIGDSDEDVYIEIVNNALNISVKTEEFELEGFGGDDSDAKTLSFVIPENADTGTYELTAKVYFDSGDENNQETFEIVITKGSGDESKTRTGPILTVNDETILLLKNNMKGSASDTISLKESKTTSKTSSAKMDEETKSQVLWIIALALAIGILIVLIGIVKVRR